MLEQNWGFLCFLPFSTPLLVFTLSPGAPWPPQGSPGCCGCSPPQKSPAKKLSHAISKSLGCVPSRDPPRPLFPEQPERPLDLAHIV